MPKTKDGCSTTVSSSLADCQGTCLTYVGDAKKLDKIRKDWEKAACTAACTGVVVCSTPTGASCVAASDPKTGVCVEIPGGAAL
jgi:hypothetical protein